MIVIDQCVLQGFGKVFGEFGYLYENVFVVVNVWYVEYEGQFMCGQCLY